MPVGLLPEHTASRIVAIQEQLNSNYIVVTERWRLIAEQKRLWDEAFPGKPFEEVAEISGPFLLATA